MPKYRVTVRVSAIEVVEADNQFMAAVAAADRHGDEVEIADVRPAVGRAPVNGKSASRKTTKKSAKAVKKVAKKRRLSPEARARLAQNLVKARAARAAKRTGTAKKSSAKRPTKKAARPAQKRATKRS